MPKTKSCDRITSMVSLFSILVTMLAGIFWLLRVAVAFAETLEMNFAVQTLNLNVEIALLFVTLLALILIIKRNMIGAIIYLVSYVLYFGADLYLTLARGTIELAAIFISSVAIIIALLVFIDVAFSKDVKNGGGNKKTNWFYGTNEYVREKDGTEDENQYKF